MNYINFTKVHSPLKDAGVETLPPLTVFNIKETTFPARGYAVRTNWGNYWKQKYCAKDPWYWMTSDVRWVKIDFQPPDIDKAILVYRGKLSRHIAKKRGNKIGPHWHSVKAKADFFRLVKLGVPVTVAAKSVGASPCAGYRWRVDAKKAAIKKKLNLKEWETIPPEPPKRIPRVTNAERDKKIWMMRRNHATNKEIVDKIGNISKARIIQVYRMQEDAYQQRIIDENLPKDPDPFSKPDNTERDAYIYQMRSLGMSLKEIQQNLLYPMHVGAISLIATREAKRRYEESVKMLGPDREQQRQEHAEADIAEILEQNKELEHAEQ